MSQHRQSQKRLIARATIAELEAMEEIECLQEDLSVTAPLFNVSHWDSAPAFRSKLHQHLRLPILPSAEPYIYSYDIEKVSLLRKVGGDARKTGCLVTASGSISTLSALNWLRVQGIKTLYVVCPTYFTVFHAAAAFGLATKVVMLRRTRGRFELPLPEIADKEALWISDPVYSTGVALHEAILRQLARVSRSGVPVILDACLKASPLYPDILKNNELLVLITSPHKAICLNGLKFSALFFDKAHTSTFEHWADALTGGLGFSSLLAVEHYDSRSFVVYEKKFQKRISETRRFLLEKIRNEGNCVTDDSRDGYFQALYFPRLSSSLGSDKAFLEKTFEACSACFIPGNRNHFDSKWGLSFRVNLARDCPQFRGAISRLLLFLGNL